MELTQRRTHLPENLSAKRNNTVRFTALGALCHDQDDIYRMKRDLQRPVWPGKSFG
jgi:hypothetical protein